MMGRMRQVRSDKAECGAEEKGGRYWIWRPILFLRLKA